MDAGTIACLAPSTRAGAVAALILLSAASAGAAQAEGEQDRSSRDDDWGFAISLLEQHDPYRAITALKHAAWAAGPGARADRANLLIGKLYSDAAQPAAAKLHFRLVEEARRPGLAFPARLLRLQEECLQDRVLIACGAELDQTEDSSGLGLVRYLHSYVELQLGRPVPPTLEAEVAPPLKAKARQLLEAAPRRANLPLKSPVLAGVLSAVLPGAGQVYDGRILDGALALGLTGLPAFGTYYFARQSNVGLAVGLGLLAAVFYFGSISNAITDARRLNEIAYDRFFGQLQQALWPRLTLAASPDEVNFGYRFGDEPPQPLVPRSAPMKE